MQEIEFEWIRQFYIQGQRHYELHKWWHQPMQTLMELYKQFDLKLILILLSMKGAASK
jgi:mRNA N6-methyladenine demethylase